jgi:hypothetical protein
VEEKPPPLDHADVEALVGNAHGDFDAVQRLVTAQPALINAAWDWGGGDWETALGAASHMGNRPIAEFLIERGGRVDIFALAMLGETDAVRAMLDAFPTLIASTGPHGIPLRSHAAKGGERANAVLELLDERSAVVS